MKSLACLVFLATLVALPALAQEQEVLRPATATKAIAAPQVTLQTGLEQLDWDPVRRGALLLVAPNTLLLTGKTPLPPPRSGYGLPELVGYFEQQVVRFSTLTTAGPTQITELRVPDRFEDLQQDFYRPRSSHAFLASLSPSQIQQAAGAQGIGYTELSDARQRALWEKLFPPNLDFRGSSAVPPAMAAGQTPWYGKQSLPVLSVGTQRTFRIRLRCDLTFLAQPGNYSVSLSETPSGFVQVALRALPVSPDKLDEYQREQAKGKSGTGKVLYRRSPSDLDLSQERFAVPLSLADAKTVGDVVQRAAKALSLELYADARLASQPVFIRIAPGQSVSAADALNAILRASATTIRRLQAGQSAAFVITHDRVPLGNTSVTLFDGILPQEMGKMQEQMSDDKAQKLALRKLRQAKLLTTLPRAAGAGASENVWQAALEGKDAKFSLTELPGDVRGKIEAAWSARQGRPGPNGVPPPAAPQSALPKLRVNVQVLCPSLGEAQLSVLTLSDLTPQPEIPLVKLPETIKTRGLRVRSPKTQEEAKQLLAMCRARGVTVLYVALSGDANDDRGMSLLSAEKDALPLVPTLSPLMPAPTDTPRERDISVTGRTASEMAQGRPALSAIAQIMPFIVPLFEQITHLDALTPEAVPVDRFAERVARLAALPGVTQIGLHDLAALGYVNVSERGLETLWTGGYSASERLAFLRTHGIDPSDFLEVKGFPNTGEFTLPFFTNSEQNTALQAAWNERRKARAVQLRKRLEAAFQTARLSKPLMQMDGGFVIMGRQQWKSWKGVAGPLNITYWEALTRLGPGGDGDSLDETSTIRKWLAQRLERKAASSEENSFPEFAALPPAGFVYDLSDVPLAQALVLLEAIIAPKN
ncbi:hypothetical protein [Armatimonas sp.]|uniref:hypothetical protein n=1 Tax=Armatimonas sp. TaxID=1872638 RepID=UPI00374D71CA